MLFDQGVWSKCFLSKARLVKIPLVHNINNCTVKKLNIIRDEMPVVVYLTSHHVFMAL